MYTPSDSLIELTAVHISILRFLPLDFGFAVAGSKEREKIQFNYSVQRIALTEFGRLLHIRYSPQFFIRQILLLLPLIDR